MGRAYFTEFVLVLLQSDSLLMELIICIDDDWYFIMSFSSYFLY